MSKIRVLIVEDEPIQRTHLRTLLESQHDIEIVAECSNGEEAVSSIRQLSPELIFLDIILSRHKDDIDGFAVLEMIGPENVPEVIFVTAYNEYAVRAFEIHALDYLLKPYNSARLQQALNRARQMLTQQREYQNLRSIINYINLPTTYPEKLWISETKGIITRTIPLEVEEIDWIEGEDNYARIYAGDQSYLWRSRSSDGPLSALEKILNPKKFTRIHHSYIINIDCIKELRLSENEVTLKNGKELAISRKYHNNLKKFL